MGAYTIHSNIYLRSSKRNLWDFLSNPANLITLTPPRFDIKMRPESSDDFAEGSVYAFSLMPFKGFRTEWLSKITHIRDGERFVDEQLVGPYSFWYHIHSIRELGDQCTQVTDRVFYGLPFGLLGNSLHGSLVKPGLKETFAYRSQAFQELFGKCDGYEPELRFTKL